MSGNKYQTDKILGALLLAAVAISLLSCGERNIGISSESLGTRDVLWNSCSRSCSPENADPFFDQGDFENRLRKAGQVSSILGKLGNSRSKFIKSGDPAELFPTIYFYTTKLEFEKVLSGRSDLPVEKLEMIISFYDAYQHNRDLYENGGPDAVEDHWKKYYSGAANFERSMEPEAKYEKMTEILFDGVDAHVYYDLPRFIRFYTRDRGEDLSALKKEYDTFNKVFSDAALSANKDILAVIFKSEPPGERNEVFKTGASYMIVARNRSWNLGIGRKPLPTKLSQPVLRHSDASTTYFPEDIRKNGICRKVRSKRECEADGFRIFKLTD
ncbi:MAG: hypothetical protein R2681_15580 [Pyrinomonadaceae bacterium]